MVRLRCSLWYLVRGIVLYHLVGSCIVLLVVLWPAVDCITSLLLWPSCRIVCSRLPCLLAALVGRLVVPVACGCLIVPGVATAWPPWVPSGGPTGDPQEGGGDFSKRGEGQTETRPVPIFMRKVKKNVVFQRKTEGKRGEFEEKEKRARKRKTRKRKRE